MPIIFICTFVLSLFLYPSEGIATPPREQIKLRPCLEKNLSFRHAVLAKNKHFKIIEIASTDLDTLAIDAEKMHCGRFINISSQFLNRKNTHETAVRALKEARNKPSGDSTLFLIKHQHEVDDMITKIAPEMIWQTVSHLTAYYNRSATTKKGAAVSGWLKTQVENMIQASGRDDVLIYFIPTGTHFPQPSVVTVIGNDLPGPAVVLGAHMDTLDGRMPGAGDNASGSAVILEVARILLSTSTALNNPIYIIWYAAEERGLVGSQQVVNALLNKGLAVKAVLQFDMAGYRAHDDPTLWIFKDNTDQQLNQFLKNLITTYLHTPVAYSLCGYGCSDHVSWNAVGIPVSFPCETSFDEHNPYIHTEADTPSLLNTEHMINFTKLGLAFLIELASK